jgi:DNA-binding response OmpR family regulator
MSKARILLIDDDETLLGLLAEHLRTADYVTLTVTVVLKDYACRLTRRLTW